MRSVVNFIAFQIGWFAAVLGAGHGMAWLGAVGGPLAYLSGAKLGAASLPSTEGLVILGITWAVAFPALLAMAEVVRRRLAARAA